ncbi:MAG: isochorismatase family cysteine hydrolase [Clostridium sp.]|uniref:isochorismatase family cysteine hydrolase n=1 Tax=Clostridium sp. TaxID=1506 RepID=UPI002FC60850
MIRVSREEMINTASVAVGEIYDNIISKESLKLSDIDYTSTALIIVDMINGFIREGMLMSSRVEDIVSPIVKIQEAFVKNKGEIIAFVDTHNEEAMEFKSYPPHCIKGSSESEIITEIKEVSGYRLIEKNSTNGFLEEKFIEFLNNNPSINNFIVVGCCTDICVMQLCLGLKTYLNNKNMDKNITVPVNCTETFDLFSHKGDFVDLMGIQLMEWAGINIVKSID